MFDYLNFKNKIPIHKFTIEIPKLNPASIEYKRYWKTQKRQCIEGRWVEHDKEYRWIPGSLHLYINFWHILLNDKNAKSKAKSINKPSLRDLEWIKHYIFATARGFSGFELDDTYSCHRVLVIEDAEEKELEMAMLKPDVRNSLYKKDGSFKEYKPALEYLYEYKSQNLGKPLYGNMALNVVDIESRGCLAKGSKVLMYDGSVKNCEDIKEGDLLMGKDSTPREVQWLHSGVEDMYKISHTSTSFKDIIVNKNHRVSVKERYFTNGKYSNGNRLPGNWSIKYTNYNVLDLYEIQEQASFPNRFSRYKAKEISFDSQEELEIDSYYLGLWLADGRSNCPSVKITDTVLRDYMIQFCEEQGYKYDVKIDHSIVENRKTAYEVYIKHLPLRHKMIEYGVLYNKHVPQRYKVSSIESRLNLLAGAIDGDGCYDKKCNSFSIAAGIDINLANDYMFIAQSLGFNSSIKVRYKEDYQPLYMVNISGDIENIPTKLYRKQPKHIDRRNDLLSSAFKIEYVGKGEFFGFHLDGDNEYLLDDFSVDHNTGKSYTMGCLCGYNFLFDGAMDYDELLSKIAEGKPLASETMVSAIDAKYSSDLISKIKLGLDHLEGAIKINGKNYSSPISKKYSGTWKAGPDPIIQLYKEKIGGKWEEKGSRSKIHHRSFRDNPFAANGTRPGFMVIDEVGFMGNLEPSLGQIKECTADGADKFGTVWMTGTSGDMDGGATEAVKKVFYAPKANNCVEFDDIFENMHKDGKPIKIGLFIPAWMGLNQFKDELGNTNREMAMRYLNRERDKLKNASSKKILNDELMQRPITHSEAFLVSGGNIFDRPELGDWISKLETDRDGYIKGKVGEFVETDTGIEFRVNNNLRACDYPIEEKEDKTGAAVMWKEPSQVVGDEAIPYGVFLGGLDPYAQDEAPNSVSLGCLLIFARATVNGQNYDELVFEYTARPDSATTFYENCRKALQYYNALCLYENNYNQFKTHMQNKNKLHLLAKTPTALKNNKADALANTYGQRMTNANGHGLKEELEVYTRDWLFDEAGDGKLNLHHIYSIPLLKELKAYNDSGNFDRAISLMLFVAQKIQMHKIQIQKKEEIKKSSWVNTNRFFRR